MGKRLFCLLMCLTVLVSMGTPVFAASFSDVPENNAFYEAIDILSDFAIILGDEGAGTFRPEAEISREEFSAIMTRVLGVAAIEPDLSVLPFLDVTPETCDKWSLIATKVAYDMGIIGGYGDGNFGPKDPITYEQVVKMLVCGLGYESRAKESGGWPTGYLKTANDLGLTKDAVMDTTANAPRGMVAQLVYNALEVDLMEPSGADSYAVRLGHNLLTDKLGYSFGEGLVTGISGLAMTHTGKRIEADEVEIDSTDIYKVGKTNAKDYFGYTGEFYYKEKSGVRTMVSFKKDSRGTEYVIEPDWIEKISDKEIEFYPTKDANKTETLSIRNAIYMYNGSAKNISEIQKPVVGSLRIIDNDGDETGDVIMVTDARVVVVSAVDATKKIVFNQYNQSDRIDLSGSDKKVKITKNGAEAQFSAITKGSVLMVTESDTSVSAEIITKTITGSVTSEEDSGEVLGIDDKEYTCSAAYLAYMKATPAEKVMVGDKATFYIGGNDQILYSKLSASSTKLGYIVFAETDRYEKSTIIRMLTSSSKMQDFTCTDRLLINSESVKYDKIPDELAKTALITNKDAGAQGADYAQLVKYTADSKGNLESLITISESGDTARNLILSKSYDEGLVYNTTTRTFKNTKISVNSNTKVILVPTDRMDEEEYAYRTYSALSNNKTYKAEVYDLSDTGVAGALVIYGNKNADSAEQIAIIKGIRTVLNEDKQQVQEMQFIMNGKEYTRYAKSAHLLDGFQAGDVVLYKQSYQNEITSVQKVFEPYSDDYVFLNKGAEGKRYYTSGSQSNGTYYYTTVCGTVYSRDDQRMLVATGDMDAEGNLDEDAEMYPIQFGSGTLFYLYDKSAKEPLLLENVTKDYISGWIEAKSGASKVMVHSNYANVKFVFIINE